MSELETLKGEVKRLKFVEADLEVERANHEATRQSLMRERLKVGHQAEVIDGLIEDLGQAEAQYRLITGQEIS